MRIPTAPIKPKAVKKKRKDKQMATYGSKGYKTLVERLCTTDAIAKHGSKEAVMSAYFAKRAKQRWAKHPEQRAKKK